MMWNSDEFKGRVAVVTGGSEGIGQDFVRALCEVGCETYFCARNANAGKPWLKSWDRMPISFKLIWLYPNKSRHLRRMFANAMARWIIW